MIAAACAVVTAGAIGYLRPTWFGSAKAPLPPGAQSAGLLGIQDLQVVSGQVAWVLTTVQARGGGRVYATADAGRTWRLLPTPGGVAEDKNGIQVLDARHGTLQLGHGLFATSDGGSHWTDVPLPPGETFGLGARFINPSVGWYLNLGVNPNSSQQPTAMWWTTDAGLSWLQRWRVDSGLPKAGNVTLEGIKYVLGFRDPHTGWLAVRRGDTSDLLATSDAGQTWLPVTLPMTEPAIATGIYFLPQRALVLTVRTSSGTWTIPSRDGGKSWEQPRPFPGGVSPPAQGVVDRPAFIDHDHWVVADGMRLQTTFDAGKSWKVVDASLPKGVKGLHDLWLSPAGSGWATGDDGETYRLLHTSDGGAHWSLIRMPL